MIILLGMAGAGKSTQCRMLSANGKYQWLSVGEYLRQLETGENRAEMLMGKILDDETVIPLVESKINDMGDNPEILLDGCPRTVRQAEWLALHSNTPEVRCVMHLMIDEETALIRLKKRAREDDSEQAMRERFFGYHKGIKPILDQFKLRGIKVIEIDACQDEEGVHHDIVNALMQLDI